jgi:hypothetical protein
VVFEMPRQRFLDLLAGNDKLSLKIYRVFVKTLSERLRQTSSQRA